MAELSTTQLAILQDMLTEIMKILSEIKESAPETAPGLDLSVFFDGVRPLFGGRLTKAQVSGMEEILSVLREYDYPLAWAAYALATTFHETARRMQPVREGLNASESWRRKNLRYYPYYGRGLVQITWLENYRKADQKLGLEGRLVADLDLALDPHISAQILALGMKEGWFTGKSLETYLPSREKLGTKAQFKNCRRIINGTDKADLIADQALAFQTALQKGGW